MMENIYAKLAQEQLDAYNNQDIEAFLAVYSDDVEILVFPSNELQYKGIELMRERYSNLFKENPNQHAALLSRMTKNNIVIDHEHVTGRANGREVFAIAMYEVTDGKISKVWFVK
ncbi:nuclear transport factor 2 family protein [Sutcliffiella cohnii]|uniref:nuclear transport factor 2 family protein n=1 Tax=Sutcliffiella sp. NC1 TaxID=3004096 RepID=UPI0022DD0764|nr:nuclear transport factor 2 family protein [Sutcliffiella sp. NC1]WBL15914.1 nuclear transport factor 2 family protein [Sutcliffiella sp. NC1]